jgi:hypothetical protein
MSRPATDWMRQQIHKPIVCREVDSVKGILWAAALCCSPAKPARALGAPRGGLRTEDRGRKTEGSDQKSVISDRNEMPKPAVVQVDFEAQETGRVSWAGSSCGGSRRLSRVERRGMEARVAVDPAAVWRAGA